MLLLAGVAVLILLNGFFVAAEFALVRCNRARLEAMAQQGGRGARLALRHYDEMDMALAACQVGITLASIGLGFMGEPTIAALLEPSLGHVLGHTVGVAAALAISYLVVTALHITTGEQVPKLYAIVHAERVARWCAVPLQVFRVALKPMIAALNGASNGMLRVVGVDPDKATDHGVSSPEELRLMISRSAHGGRLDAGEAGMLSGVFHLHEQEARQVMTPFPAVVCVDVSQPVHAAVRTAVEAGHTRLVVCDGSKDNIRGVVHSSTLTRILLDEGPDASIEPAVKDAMIIPETKPLDDLLAELQRQHLYLAVVVDEYGRVSGLVTVEDILEEIVGEIADELDDPRPDVERVDEHEWLVDGHVAVNDLVDYGLVLPIDSETFNSIGGYVFSELGHLPGAGEQVRCNGHVIEVLEVQDNRVQRLRIRNAEPES